MHDANEWCHRHCYYEIVCAVLGDNYAIVWTHLDGVSDLLFNDAHVWCCLWSTVSLTTLFGTVGSFIKTRLRLMNTHYGAHSIPRGIVNLKIGSEDTGGRSSWAKGGSGLASRC